MVTPLVSVESLSRRYGTGRRARSGGTLAVDDVSFTVVAGETLALVGESGSGKSTVGRLVLNLDRPTAGTVRYRGQALGELGDRENRALRRHMQVVFQDPYTSLNPQMRAGDLVGEPLRIHRVASNRSEIRDRVAELFRRVGLSPDMMGRLPREFSGGQRQRINIARAIALQPSFIVADEPITALDVSIQAQIVNLLEDIQRDTGVSYLFISHDLGVVRHVSHRVAVMRAGRIVELAPTADLFERPRHAYTRALIDAMPVADPRLEKKRVPQPVPPPASVETLVEVAPGHWVAQ